MVKKILVQIEMHTIPLFSFCNEMFLCKNVYNQMTLAVCSMAWNIVLCDAAMLPNTNAIKNSIQSAVN